jgi:hypothetical protein
MGLEESKWEAVDWVQLRKTNGILGYIKCGEFLE